MLTVGGIEPRKGSLTLLEGFARAARALPDRDPLLVIAGGTTLFDYRHELERFAARAQELGVTEHVRVLGALEPDEIERLYRAADVFAFPSVKEGFGLAALEALAAELPVVASDLDVFRDFLDDGESALLTRSATRAALAAALARVARDDRAARAAARRWRRGRRGVRLGRASGAAHERAYERRRARWRGEGQRHVPRRLRGHRRASAATRSRSTSREAGGDDAA